MDSPAFYSLSPSRNHSKNGSSSKSSSKVQLKSSIPVPAAATRRQERSKSASSCLSQPAYSTRLPPPVSERDTSLPLSHPPSGTVSTSSRKQPVRPKTASYLKNPYANVKSKVNSAPPSSTGCLKSHFHHPKINRKKSNESDESNAKKSAVESSDINAACEVKSVKNNEIAEKQKELLSIYNQLKKLKPSEELQPLEVEICSLMEKKTLGHLDGLSRENSYLKECMPEFLYTFENQMQEVSELWLKLINDVISTKMTFGKTAASRLSLPDPSLDLHDEVARFLTNLPTEGEPLHEKLRKIEEEKMRVLTVVMHNVVALAKEHSDLKDENTRLKKTQDQINFQQNEQMAILAQENKDLDRKYGLAVEKYKLEMSKAEQQEKALSAINKEMADIKKQLKFYEGRCTDIEGRTKKADAGRRSLEVALRNLELALEKEGKQHRDLFEKYSRSEEIIHKLKYELEERKCMASSLEETNKDLQVELNNVKSSLDENIEKRNDLLEELANKTKKLNEMKEQLDLLKSDIDDESEQLALPQDYTSNLVVKDLTRQIQEKISQIHDLKKKQLQMETHLRDMASREKLLMNQVNELKKRHSDTDVILQNQVQELQYRVKDLETDKAELEKILAQKTLELDQRDLMMQQHKKLLQARDQLIPMIQDRQENEQQCTEKLMAIVYEHYKTFNPDADCARISSQNPYGSLEAMEKYYGLDPITIDKELSFRQEKMSEMFNLLEHKQIEISKLEHRIRELQGVHSLDNTLEHGRKMNKSRGFLSMFYGAE